MPMTLAQIDELIDAYTAALARGEIAFRMPNGREATFPNTDALIRALDWLKVQRRELLAAPASEGGAGADGEDGALAVRFVEGN